MGIYLGSFGDDDINGSTFGDVITALGGNDTIVGRDGADVIDGGDGNDVIYAGSQQVWADGQVDTILAGAGDDQVYAGFGDAVNGGFGFDRLSLDMSLSESGVTVDFRPMTLLDLTGLVTIDLGGARLAGFEAIDTLIGSDHDDDIIIGNRDRIGSNVDVGAGNDYVRSGNGADHVVGGTGNDHLVGQGGADTLIGGAGNDFLNGGAGRDTLTGGDGVDLFQFLDNPDIVSRGQIDTVTDFSHADGDRIVLRGIDAIVGGSDDAFTLIGSHQFTGTAGELRTVFVDGAALVSGDTNGDGTADFLIRLEGVTALSVSDFAL